MIVKKRSVRVFEAISSWVWISLSWVAVSAESFWVNFWVMKSFSDSKEEIWSLRSEIEGVEGVGDVGGERERRVVGANCSDSRSVIGLGILVEYYSSDLVKSW